MALLVQELKNRDIDPWWDRNSLLPGAFWPDKIRRAIWDGYFFLACFSNEYLKSGRTFMNEELTIAIEEIRLRGDRFDRTQEYAARRRGVDFERLRYATHHTVEISPLPCWEDLSLDLQKKRIEEIAQEIEDEAKARIEEKGVPPLGPDAVRRQSLETIPSHTKKSPAPLFLAASKRIRDDLRTAYYSFVAAFREAADQLKTGNRNAHFPEGSFPPAMPFVSG